MTTMNRSTERHIVRANAAALAGSMGMKVVWENRFKPRCLGKTVYLPNPGVVLGDERDFVLVFGAMCHELGHYNFTDWSVEFTDDQKWELRQLITAAKTFWNVMEDIFIERQMAKAWPGVGGRLKSLAKLAADEGFWTVECPEEEPAAALCFGLLKHLRVVVLGQTIPDEAESTDKAKAMFGQLWDRTVTIAMDALSQSGTKANLDAAYEIVMLLKQEQQQSQPGAEADAAAGAEAGDGEAEAAAGAEAGDGEAEAAAGAETGDGEADAAAGAETDAECLSQEQQKALGDALDGNWDIKLEISDFAEEVYDQKLEEGGDWHNPMREAPLMEAPLMEFSDRTPSLTLSELVQQFTKQTTVNEIVGELGARLDDLLQAQTQCRERVANSGRKLHRRRICHLDMSPSVFAKSHLGEEISTAIQVLVDVSASTLDPLLGSDGTRFKAADRILAATVSMAEIFSRYEVPLQVTLYSDVYLTVKSFDEDWHRVSANRAFIGGGTHTHLGLQMFAEELVMREEERKLLVLVTDGDPGDPMRFAEIAKTLPEVGVELRVVYIAGVSSGVDPNEVFYQAVAPTAVARSGWDVSRSIYEALASDFEE